MSIRIKKEGMLTTLQGLGEFGMQRFGVNPRGAMDRTAVRLINVILNNSESEPAIEFHFPAGEILFEKACVIAVGGAHFNATLNGEVLDNWCSVAVPAESSLKFERRARGNRCYLSLEGGFKRPEGWPRFESPRLKLNDRMDFNAYPPQQNAVCGRRISNSVLPIYSNFPTVRVTCGGEYDVLSAADQRTLSSEIFVITNESNRMGFRLQSEKFGRAQRAEMASSAVTFGTVQLLPDGGLIVLMADHQTSGGYPRIANVISVDLPLLAQLGANDRLAFKLVDIEEAEAAALDFERDFRRLKIGCEFGKYW